MIPESVCHAVGAQQELISRLPLQNAELWSHKLIARPQRLRQHVLPRMKSGFPFIELASPSQPSDVRVVVRDLRHPTGSRQVIDPAVPDMPEVATPLDV